jgi:DHA2 family multidrug resistance protein
VTDATAGAGGGAQAKPAWKPKANPWSIALIVTLAAFMEVLDTTIVNVALPHIAGSLSASQDDATWALTSYLVANGIVLPISGFLSQLLGRKRYFLICIGSFTVCSFMCGLSTSLPELIIFRLLQGFFGGGLQPNQQSIILDTFEPSQRGRAFSITAIATIVAPVLGPTLGGYLVDTYTWRWIFLINIPVGLICFLGVLALVEDPPWQKSALAKGQKVSTDYIGIGLITLGLGCLQVFLDRGEDDDWTSSHFIVAMMSLSAIGIAGAVTWLLYTEKPIVNLRVLKDKNFALGCMSIFIMAFILYSSAVLIPQLAQREFGYTATWAGLVLSPGAALIIFLIPIMGKLLPIVQTRFIIAAGFFVMGFALIYSHNLTPTLDFKTLASMRMAQTIALAFLFVPISTISYVTVPKELNGDAAALYTMFRNVAGSIGISLATSLITTRTQVHLSYLAQYMTPLYEPFNETISQLRNGLMMNGTSPDLATPLMFNNFNMQAAILAYEDVFSTCSIMAFCAVPMCLLFSPIKASRGKGGGH